MSTLGWSLGRGIVMCTAMALSACGFADQFSERSVGYNLQAERAQAENLLLNVVRASLRRPMQFSAVDSVQGGGSEKESISFTIPFGHSHGPKSFQLGGEETASVSSFTTAILDTQEFYNGITTPIAKSFADLLIKQGYSRSMIFYTLVKSIEIDLDENQRITVDNYVMDDCQYDLFQTAMDYLIQSGMTTEQTEDHTSIGPFLSKLEAAKQAVTAAKENLELVEIKGKGFRVKQSKAGYRLCFNPLEAFDGRIDQKSSARCGQKDLQVTREQRSEISPIRPSKQESAKDPESHEPSKLSGRDFPQKLADGLRIRLEKRFNELKIDPYTLGRCVNRELKIHRRPAESKQAVTLNLRSPEAILFYLGEVVRRHLDPEFGFRPRIIQIKSGPSDAPMPNGICPAHTDPAHVDIGNDYRCENVFLVDKGGNESSISVNYGGETYWLHDEPREHGTTGLSLSVLDFMKQLIALNKSAKQLPAAGALSVIVTP
jgi:hypothetical protein